jgi:hypothetical protein
MSNPMISLSLASEVKLVVYVPETHKEAVKSALFAAGAGGQGAYNMCAFEVLGEGQFRPHSAAKPHIGEANRLSHVAEYRIEMLVPLARLEQVVTALRATHPYEEPAFDIVPRLDPTISS